MWLWYDDLRIISKLILTVYNSQNMHMREISINIFCEIFVMKWIRRRRKVKCNLSPVFLSLESHERDFLKSLSPKLFHLQLLAVGSPCIFDTMAVYLPINVFYCPKIGLNDPAKSLPALIGFLFFDVSFTIVLRPELYRNTLQHIVHLLQEICLCNMWLYGIIVSTIS